MKSLTRSLIILVALGLSCTAFSTTAHAERKAHKIGAIQGRISALKHGRDRKGKNFWEYRVKTADGKMILVHDYKIGRYREPASVGIADGKKVKAKGFYVNIRTQVGSEDRTKVFIIPRE